MLTRPGRHFMDVDDIHDADAVNDALRRDHRELIDEVYRLQRENRRLRHWAILWKSAAWLQREKRRLGV